MIQRYRLFFLGFGAAVMLVPAVAMQFTDEVRWGFEDFGAAVALLAVAWFGLEIIFHLVKRRRSRLVASAAVALCLLAVWAHLAVGL